ncbi:MAG: hypothetical protein ACREJD_15385 [Phycisphaerales bacterium]
MKNCVRAGLLVCVASASAWAQSLQTLPPAFDAAPGNSGNSIPLANYTSAAMQVMYGADLLTGIPVGSVITGMQVRLEKNFSSTFPTSAFTITRYDIRMATSSLTPATMSATYASNLTSPVLVRSGSLDVAAGAYQFVASGPTVPQPWGPVIPFTTGFVYTGGPLVIEFRMVSPSSTFAAYADVINTGSSQRYMFSENAPDAAAAGSGPSAGGPIVRLTHTPAITDLAKGVTKVFVGENFAGTLASPGDGDGVLMWTSAFTHQAVAAANQFDTIGPGSDFVGMTWRQYSGLATAWPAAPATFSQFDVQLSRSANPPATLSTTIASNVGADAVQVRAGALSLPTGAFGPIGTQVTTPFGTEVAFTNAYHYRGGPLLSVVRHSGQGSGVPGYFDGILTNGPGYGSDVKGYQTVSASATVAASASPYLTTRFSVDAGTSSPLNQLSPGADTFGITVTPVLQTVLSASELAYIPVGSVIDSLWLRQNGSAGNGPSTAVTATDFELSVSTATAPPSGMSATFAANEGSDKVLVYDGGLVVPAGVMPAGSNGNFGKIVQFQKNFVYKGGPLCITIRHTGLSGDIGRPEAVFGSSQTNRSTYAFGVGATTGDFYGGGFTGTATKLGYIPSVMTPNSLAAAEGSSAWSLPFISNYSVQTIIPASQLRTVTVGSAITGFSLRADGFNGVGIPATATNLSQFDVSIAPAAHAPLAISTIFASNIGPGAVMVRSGPMTVPANAYPALGAPSQNAWYVPFTRAYVYTGGDLCVTFRGQGPLTADSFYLDGQGSSPIATGGSIYNYGDAAATTGDTWGPIAMRLAFTPRAFCPWDLNNDGVVDDGDFPIFLLAYNTLDCTDPSMAFGCPADFNHDGVVDDLDFQAFVVAYNNLVCP